MKTPAKQIGALAKKFVKQHAVTNYMDAFDDRVQPESKALLLSLSPLEHIYAICYSIEVNKDDSERLELLSSRFYNACQGMASSEFYMLDDFSGPGIDVLSDKVI